jgi:hypothetical protein
MYNWNNTEEVFTALLKGGLNDFISFSVQIFTAAMAVYAVAHVLLQPYRFSWSSCKCYFEEVVSCLHQGKRHSQANSHKG